jgi:hypothetical protein
MGWRRPPDFIAAYASDAVVENRRSGVVVAQSASLYLTRKILGSGAGHIERPLVTATDEEGRRLRVLPKLGASDRADLSAWKAPRSN